MQLHSFLTLELDEGSPYHAPVASTPGEECRRALNARLVGSTASLGVRRRNLLPLPGFNAWQSSSQPNYLLYICTSTPPKPKRIDNIYQRFRGVILSLVSFVFRDIYRRLLYFITQITFTEYEICRTLSGFNLWYQSSRVQTRTKPSHFSGRKNPPHAFLRKGSKAVCPTSQIYAM